MMNEIEKFSKRSKQGAFISLFGFFLVVLAFGVAGSQLIDLNDEIKAKNNILDSIDYKIDALKHDKDSLDRRFHEAQVQQDSLYKVIEGLQLGKNYVDKGITQYYSGNFKKAIVYYDSAITKFPKNSAAYGLKGQAQIIVRRYKGAKASLTKSLQLDSHRPQTYYSLIFLHTKKNEIDSATKYLGALLDIAPHYINNVKADTYLSTFTATKRFLHADTEQKLRLQFVQGKLKELGFYDGDVDGSPGMVTFDAILKYQRASGLFLSGTWDKATLKKLGYTNF